MPKLSDANKQSRFKLLQVGKSGDGKTTRSLTAVQFGPVLFIDLDEKLVTLANKVDKKDQDKVHYETPKSLDEVKGILDGLHNENPYATVVLDTWSRLYDMIVDAHRQKVNRDKFNFDDWGVIKRQQQNLVKAIFKLPNNIIFNTHVGQKEDVEGKAMLTVGTSGSFGQTLPEYFQETHYLFYDGMRKKFKAQGTKSSKIVANTGRSSEMLDEKGCFKSEGLDIFADVAYKK